MNRTFREALLDLIYPPFHLCPHCGHSDTFIHPDNGALCDACFGEFPFLKEDEQPEEVRALAHYKQGARSLIYRLKYREALYLAKPMAVMMAEGLRLEHPDMVVPVPMHSRRRKERGYNQADRLARHIASRVKSTYEPGILQRTRETVPMYQLNRLERIQNMWESIAVHPLHSYKVVDRTILLVDDIYTTGATAQACIKVLEEGGAARVTVAAFALADLEPV